MPFLRSSTRPQAAECFFCLSPAVLPPDHDRKGKARAAGPRSWQCPRCGCLNGRDERGNVLSDHPAMHNSALNERSFSLRARPSTSHLPSTSSSSTSPFCHSCLTNQTLIMNLLANYLPADDDPTFAQLYADLPAYVHSLHQRYPPVCRSCQPVVDDTLRRSDQRAQVEAWGSALRRGAGERAAPGPSTLEVGVWRVRGAMFVVGTTGTWAVTLIAWMESRVWLEIASTFARVIAAFQALAILWIAWDPHWLRRVRSQGRVSVAGRAVWVRNNLAAWLVRLLIASAVIVDHGRHHDMLVKLARGAFALDLVLFLYAFFNLRVSAPVALRLVRPAPLAASPARPSPPLPSFNQPRPAEPVSRPPSAPVFGQLSLGPQTADDAIEWEPAPARPFSVTRRPPLPPGVPSDGDMDIDVDVDEGVWPAAMQASAWDTFGTGKQRVFAAQQETGLEALLATWGIGTEQPPRPAAARQSGLLPRKTVRLLWLGIAAVRAAGAVVALADAGTDRLAQSASAPLVALETAATLADLATCETRTRAAAAALNAAARVAAIAWLAGARAADRAGWLGEWATAAGWAGWALVDVLGAL